MDVFKYWNTVLKKGTKGRIQGTPGSYKLSFPELQVQSGESLKLEMFQLLLRSFLTVTVTRRVQKLGILDQQTLNIISTNNK